MQTIRRAHAVQPVTALQSEYSLWWREPEAEVLADAARSSASASCPSARWARASSPGKIDENTTFDGTDFRNTVPRFTPEARKANQALVDLLGDDRRAEEGDAGPDRARLAARAEALDRADPGHHEAASPGGEPRRRPPSSSRPTTSARSTPRPRRDHGARGSLSRAPGGKGRSLTRNVEHPGSAVRHRLGDVGLGAGGAARLGTCSPVDGGHA